MSYLLLQLVQANIHVNLKLGGVRTQVALHHGRKTKSESFASCRGRVNISVAAG